MNRRFPSKAKVADRYKILKTAMLDSFRKLNPRTMVKNPVMFVVEVGALLTSIQLIRVTLAARRRTSVSDCRSRSGCGSPFCSPILLKPWPKDAARPKQKLCAKPGQKRKPAVCARTAQRRLCPAQSCALAIKSLVAAGEFIPGDGEVVEGVASVDESAITGESAPVIRESGGDRSAVTGGTRVLSDEIRVRITSNPGETFLDRMISLVEGASRQKTPNEIALNILLAGLTIIFLLAVVTLQPFAIYSGRSADHFRSGIAPRLPDSHYYWRPFVRHWNCGHGSLDPEKCHRHVGPRRGSIWRRGRSASGQNRHNHAW